MITALILRTFLYLKLGEVGQGGAEGERTKIKRVLCFVLIGNANSSQNSISKEAYAQEQQERRQSTLFLLQRYLAKDLSMDFTALFFILKSTGNQQIDTVVTIYSGTAETKGFLFKCLKP